MVPALSMRTSKRFSFARNCLAASKAVQIKLREHNACFGLNFGVGILELLDGTASARFSVRSHVYFGTALCELAYDFLAETSVSASDDSNLASDIGHVLFDVPVFVAVNHDVW